MDAAGRFLIDAGLNEEWNALRRPTVLFCARLELPLI